MPSIRNLGKEGTPPAGEQLPYSANVYSRRLCPKDWQNCTIYRNKLQENYFVPVQKIHQPRRLEFFD